MRRRKFLTLFGGLFLSKYVSNEFVKFKDANFSGNLFESKVYGCIDYFYQTTDEIPFQRFDTQRIHIDYITTLPGVEYFLIGNGEITVGIQFCKDGNSGASLFGLTLWDAERFVRKWSTFLYHPERGFENTKLTLQFGEEFYQLNRENFQEILWDFSSGIPIVKLKWGNEKFSVLEKFFVPKDGKILFRVVEVSNKLKSPMSISLRLQLYPNFGLFDEIFTSEREKTVYAKGWTIMKLQTFHKGARTAGRYDLWVDIGTVDKNAEVVYVYSLEDDDKILKVKNFTQIFDETSKFWDEKNKFRSDSEVLNHLFNVSKNGLKSTVSKSGKRDSGIWQYNMEWVRDDSMFVLGLLMCGFFDEAKIMLTKLLDKFVGREGQTIESSRWFGYELTELDQNGQLLYAVWSYVCWGGDFEFVKKFWDKIKLVAEFPLKDVFWDKNSKLLKNKREFWERTDAFGVENGYELAYQFWVSLGLEKVSELAKKLGENKLAQRWLSASGEIKNSMLNDPVFKLIEDGHFIKRKNLNGQWQRYFIPPDRKRMPQNSPIAIEDKPSAEPDTSEVLPIIYGFVDAGSEVSIKTLEWIEKLWNQRWSYGGYERYDSSSEPEPPGSWPFASLFVARANLEAKNYERVWRILNWLYNINGGKSGGWFEYYSVEQLTPPLPPVGIIGWTWAEMISLFVYHILGFRPELENLTIKPNLLSGVNLISSSIKVRNILVDLDIERSDKMFALVDGREFALKNGKLILPYSGKKVKIKFFVK